MTLLDSNAFLWLLYYPDKVGPLTRGILETETQLLVSVVSLWELAIKYSNGNLPYSPEDLAAGAVALGAEQLPIKSEHLKKLVAVNLPQKDPFDRLLIAQSDAEGCAFITSDTAILKSGYRVYDVAK